MEARVKDVIQILNRHYPPRLAESWDNVGLQLGDPEQTIRTIAVSLDPSPGMINQAREAGAGLLITHHPLFFSPVKSLNFSTLTGSTVKLLMDSQISLFSAHTNLDSAPRGLNQYLAERLGLENIQPWFSGRQDSLYKLVVFVPASHQEQVRQALTQSGAGCIGAYSDSTFRISGTGTFRPLPGTNPYIGRLNHIEEVEEYRIETVLLQSLTSRCIDAMLAAHPYEEVAYDLYPLTNQGTPITPGRKGLLTHSITLAELAKRVKQCLCLDSLSVVGSLKKQVRKIAVVSGSGASLISDLLHQDIDVLITGDVKYHEACAARDQGLAVIDAGHQGTEQIVVEMLSVLLKEEIGKLDFDCQIKPLYEEICLKIL